jgi:CRISPR-associated protein Csm3
MAQERKVELKGRVFLRGSIEAVTGLHIGAGRAPMAVGGMDNPVVRDPLTDKPYIPGSSLKGKLRSLLEKKERLEQNQRMGTDVYIHICKKPQKESNETEEHYQNRRKAAHQSYRNCPVCPIFGVPGEDAFELTRLLVRDVPLDKDSAKRLDEARTDLPYTEVKWEAAIDRITSAASPRQMERVPAGALFKPMELVFNIYEEGDVDRLSKLLEALRLLEDDYLGGLGSRGSGKVAFKELKLTFRSTKKYEEEQEFSCFATLDELLSRQGEALDWLRGRLPGA